MTPSELLKRNLESAAEVTGIPDEFIIVKDPVFRSTRFLPCKTQWITAVICRQGSTHGRVNVNEYSLAGKGFVIVLPGQVLEYDYISEDFKGYLVLMSRGFTDSIAVSSPYKLSNQVENKPYMVFSEEAFEAMQAFLDLCIKMMAVHDETTIAEVLRLLSRAFFLGVGKTMIQGNQAYPQMGRADEITCRFLELAESHCREHRNLDFYADALCITPKYLSLVVKASSGKTAGQWIEQYLVQEAKALLLSSRMTIQQISDTLGFPNQSYFGKYFRRLCGLSPRDYRKSALTSAG